MDTCLIELLGLDLDETWTEDNTYRRNMVNLEPEDFRTER
jgi:hypothetical protein